jgi:hypothetical protein
MTRAVLKYRPTQKFIHFSVISQIYIMYSAHFPQREFFCLIKFEYLKNNNNNNHNNNSNNNNPNVHLTAVCFIVIYSVNNTTYIQGDQKVSVHLMITIQNAGAQRLFDHPVYIYIYISVFNI